MDETVPIGGESVGQLAVAAADRVFRGGINSGGSAFAPGVSAWTAEAAADLRRCFVEKPDAGGDDFLTKLQRQLSDASPQAVVLAAELLYLNMLPLHEGQISRATKRHILQTVLGWAKGLSESAVVPTDLDEAMAGFIGGGMAFMTLRWAQLQLLIQLVEKLFAMDEHARAQILKDPWQFRDLCGLVVSDMGNNKARAQVQILLHLLFPDTFIDSASLHHKILMRDAFTPEYLAVASDDVDRDLSAIRDAIKDDTGSPADLYAKPWVDAWRKTVDSDARRCWLLRGANVQGRNYISDWLGEGFCSISLHEVPPIDAGTRRSKITAVVKAAMTEATAQERASAATQLFRFMTEMKPNDVIVTVDGDAVYVGTLTGDAYNVADGPIETRRRRRVEWRTTAVSRIDLPDQARARLNDPHTVSDMTAVLADFMNAAGISGSEDDEAKSGKVVAALELPAATEVLADGLHFEVDWVQQTIDVLRRRKQVIFYGPPGTGKTYAARKIAEHVAPGNVRLVQFHPSYTYEDFFEGYRPVVENGQVAFDLVDGPFKRLAKEAEDNPGQPYVLIIDEINRANLAKVFGELYFLLEYRGQSVTTQYSKDELFSLPHNVYVIGTMNTADRSIALVDAALRRRFAFRRLAPDCAPVDTMLSRWLKAEKLSANAAGLLKVLNARLADADRAIGPTYFMDPLIDDEKELRLVWDSQILPLLEDQLYGSGRDIAKEFALDALRSESNAAEPTPTDDAASGAGPSDTM